MSIQPQFDSNHDEWILAVDLLIARATLEEELRASLLSAPKQTCRSHGIKIPEGVQVVITSAEQQTLVREIPATLPSGSFEKTSSIAYFRESALYNGAAVEEVATAQVQVYVDPAEFVVSEVTVTGFD